MAKQRKTREQKISTSEKRQQGQFVYSLAKPTLIKEAQVNFQKTLPSYSYVYNDLRKTIIVCGAIVAFQLILFFILQHHVITIPGVSY
jgi:hypothetical protein